MYVQSEIQWCITGTNSAEVQFDGYQHVIAITEHMLRHSQRHSGWVTIPQGLLSTEISGSFQHGQIGLSSEATVIPLSVHSQVFYGCFAAVSGISLVPKC